MWDVFVQEEQDSSWERVRNGEAHRHGARLRKIKGERER